MPTTRQDLKADVARTTALANAAFAAYTDNRDPVTYTTALLAWANAERDRSAAQDSLIGLLDDTATALARQRWDNRPALPPPTTKGGKIRAARVAKGWRLEDLAAETGLSKNTLCHYELGTYAIPPARQEIIAEALKINLACD